MHQELLEDLAIANRILVNEGVLDGFGHISVRNPDRTDRFYIARSMAPALVTVDDIVAYLRTVANPDDTVSLRRILNTPRRGIGDRAEACVAVHAENRGISFYQALVEATGGTVPLLNTRAVNQISGVRNGRRRSGSVRRSTNTATETAAKAKSVPELEISAS